MVAVAGVSSGQEEDSKVAESSHSAGYSVIHSLPPAPTPAFTHHQVGPLNIDIDSVMNTRASNKGSLRFHNHGQGTRPLLGPSPH